MDKKLVIFNYILLILSMMIFGEYLISFATYSSSYILFLLFFILLALHVFITGLICNKNKIYKKNIRIYMILYIVLLISLTIFINRPEFALFDAKFFSIYVNEINLVPFKTIIHFIVDNANLGVKLYNLIGNLIALMPLSFLLILIDKKYDSYKEQLKILLIAVLGIELFQFLLSAGRLDIDDFILNIGGALLFFTIIKKLNILGNAREFFSSDLNIPKMTKYILLAFVSIAVIIMDVLFIIDLNMKSDTAPKEEYLSVIESDECNTVRKEEVNDYTLYFDCVSVYVHLLDDSEYTIEDAISKNLFDINNLPNFFQVVTSLSDATVYKNEDLTIFTCNNSSDVYLGNASKEYNGECS